MTLVVVAVLAGLAAGAVMLHRARVSSRDDHRESFTRLLSSERKLFTGDKAPFRNFHEWTMDGPEIVMLRVRTMRHAVAKYGRRQRLIDKVFEHYPESRYDLERTEIVRVSGDCPCPDCGYAYGLHPYAKEPTTELVNGSPEPFCHLACSGRRLKL